jgi:hypothetical protein
LISSRCGRLAASFGAILMVSLAIARNARAGADGPDFWAVKGVGSDDVLNLRAEPSPMARTIGAIPHDACILKNLGCRGGPTFAQWSGMTPAERQRVKKASWCKVEFDGERGWVAGRFLKEN